MNKYEIMVVLKPLLPDDIRRDTIKKIETVIKKLKGKVVKSEVWGKRHLAYEIKGHTDGYYILWGVEMPPASTNLLDKEIKLTAEILRHLILSVKEFDLREIK